jgi:hypothetical protein
MAVALVATPGRISLVVSNQIRRDWPAYRGHPQRFKRPLAPPDLAYPAGGIFAGFHFCPVLLEIPVTIAPNCCISRILSSRHLH